MADTTIAFNAPFEDQLAFFRKKTNVPTARWDDIMRSAHDHGFMVAGAMQADLIADFRTAIDKAIELGTGLAEFRKDFDKIVKRYGWDYTGGRDWRTSVIYKTNLTASYSAGRFIQLSAPEVSRVRPYWLYRHSDSVLSPRPEHESWDGKIVAANDSWWKTHYPPNGWGCQCYVFAIAKDELAKYGKKEPDAAPTAPQSTAGIDKGWDYAPGQSAAERIYSQKESDLKAKDPDVAKLFERLNKER